MSMYDRGLIQWKTKNISGCKKKHARSDTRHAVIVNRLCERKTTLFACQIIYCHPDPK